MRAERRELMIDCTLFCTLRGDDDGDDGDDGDDEYANVRSVYNVSPSVNTRWNEMLTPWT